jgi:hypothetical protein
MLRDTIVSHAGLREAIAVTAEVAPEVIRPAVRRLAARAERDSLASGLRRFAEEVADPVADLIVAALAVAADGQARNLPALLSGIAGAARAEAGMRVRVETGRARTYSSSRALVAITFGLSVSLLVFAPEFMAPYDAAGGQLVLSIIGALFTGALVALVALSRPIGSPRLLAGVTERLGAERCRPCWRRRSWRPERLACCWLCAASTGPNSRSTTPWPTCTVPGPGGPPSSTSPGGPWCSPAHPRPGWSPTSPCASATWPAGFRTG